MKRIDIAKACKEIGLTEPQADSLWRSLQAIQINNSKSDFLTRLLYFGALIAFLSMTWFYIAHLESSYSLLISIVYALVFFCSGFYFWHAKKLRIPGGVLCSLGIVMVPLIVYSLQNMMDWRPTTNHYADFYRWINDDWVPMEICTFFVACISFYFIRFPFITALIYSVVSFMCIDAVCLFADSESDQLLYDCMAFIVPGSLLNVWAWILCKQNKKDFGFWAYLVGMFLFWSGLTIWGVESEWGYFTYFLVSLLCIFTSRFFHYKIFMAFGFLGVIFYMGHLAYVFSDSSMFSYILAAIGFSVITLAAFLMHIRKCGSRVNLMSKIRLFFAKEQGP